MPELREIFYACGSVLLWRGCDTLRTSGGLTLLRQSLCSVVYDLTPLAARKCYTSCSIRRRAKTSPCGRGGGVEICYLRLPRCACAGEMQLPLPAAARARFKGDAADGTDMAATVTGGGAAGSAEEAAISDDDQSYSSEHETTDSRSSASRDTGQI